MSNQNMKLILPYSIRDKTRHTSLYICMLSYSQNAFWICASLIRALSMCVCFREGTPHSNAYVYWVFTSLSHHQWQLHKCEKNRYIITTAIATAADGFSQCYLARRRYIYSSSRHPHAVYAKCTTRTSCTQLMYDVCSICERVAHTAAATSIVVCTEACGQHMWVMLW